MGCDIHTYVEIYKDNKWIQIDPLTCSIELEKKYYHYNASIVNSTNPIEEAKFQLTPRPVLSVSWEKQIFSGRNYTLFGLLAGVRSSFHDSHIPPRGLPEDMSDTLRDIVNHDYDHTGHWYTLKELLQIKYPSELAFFFSRRKRNSTINKLKRRAKKYDVPFDKIRIVFWFDS